MGATRLYIEIHAGDVSPVGWPWTIAANDFVPDPVPFSLETLTRELDRVGTRGEAAARIRAILDKVPAVKEATPI
jgi:hypothetical protein